MKKILISGYYGFNNFGDDAILHVLVSSLKSNLENPNITVISNNPELTKQDYKVNSVYKFDYKAIFQQLKQTDLFISGGGSLLQDVTSFKSLFYYLSLIFLAKILNTKVCIYAQGIGPIKSKIGKFLTGNLLKIVDLVTVRDEKSQDLLKKLGVESILTSDPVWDIQRPDESSENLQINKEKIQIGVQLREWKSLTDEKLKDIAKAVNSHFGNDKYQITLISLQDTQDLDAIKNLEQALKSINKDIDIKIASKLSINDAINIISELDYCIAMRYHACLISIKFNIPTLAISYDPKVEILSKQSEIPYLSLDDLDEADLSQKILELVDSNFYKDKLITFSTKNQMISRQNIYLLIKMLDGNRDT